MLKQRITTSLVGLPLLVAAIWSGEPWFTIFVVVWGSLAVLEFYRLVTAAKATTPLYGLGLIWTVLFILNPYLGSEICGALPKLDYETRSALLLTSLIVISMVWLLVRPGREGAFNSWAWTLAGVLYVGWLLGYLVAMRGLDSGRGWVFLTLFTTFASDTSAFFIGRAWGRRCLAPVVSPSKTWEGATAGVIGAMMASVALAVLFDLPLSYRQAVLLGLVISIFGQLGDLAESLLKRNVGAKESGRLIPGHGGVLDRMDSVVFAGVVVYYYVFFAGR